MNLVSTFFVRVVAGASLAVSATIAHAAAFPVPDVFLNDTLKPIVAFNGSNYNDIYDERIYKNCRRQVNKTLGRARGKHARSYRLAYTQQCMINGGTHW